MDNQYLEQILELEFIKVVLLFSFSFFWVGLGVFSSPLVVGFGLEKIRWDRQNY